MTENLDALLMFSRASKKNKRNNKMTGYDGNRFCCLDIAMKPPKSFSYKILPRVNQVEYTLSGVGCQF